MRGIASQKGWVNVKWKVSQGKMDGIFLTMPRGVVSHRLPLSHILHFISACLVSPSTSLLLPDFSSQLKTF